MRQHRRWARSLWKGTPGGIRSIVSLAVLSSEGEDRGMGIVFSEHPLTILVPLHVVVSLDADPDVRIMVNGVEAPNPRILSTPGLQRDDLGLLRFDGGSPDGIARVRLPRRAPTLTVGQEISLYVTRDGAFSERRGRVSELMRQGDGLIILTDIEVEPGDSGGALISGDELVGICQGMFPGEGSGRAIGVPLNRESLRELQGFRAHKRSQSMVVLLGLIATLLVAAGAFWAYSRMTFQPGVLTVDEARTTITVENRAVATLRPSWSHTFATMIRSHLLLASTADGVPDHVAVGTQVDEGTNGAVHLFDHRGTLLWDYAISDGACPFDTDEEVYHGFVANTLLAGDLDADGTMELLVSFVHDHWFPCKLVVFRLDGSIVAEYWHPGYIRTMVVGQVGRNSEPLLVLSASNNRFRTDWWNPQTLFAFRGLAISGQAPPYTGTNIEQGSELWYQRIDNVDPETKRAKGYNLDILDWNGDGVTEIRAALSDGRFYYLDEMGTTVGVDLGDSWLKEFGDTSPPPLADIGLREAFDLEAARPPAPETPST